MMIVIERIPGPVATIYEKATRMVIDIYYGEVAEGVVSHLRTGKILDLGTGPGYLPIEIVKRAPLMRVDGIDLGRKLIKMARANALRAGVADRVHFEIGDASRMRFENESYDMVISTGMLHMLRNPVKVLRECYRVLKPDCEAWIYDPAQVSSRMNRRRWKASFTLRERFFFKLFSLYTRINPPHTYDRKEIISMIASTDFREYRIEEEGKEIKIRLKKRGIKS
ncbi:MAG: class I SAM-dependent methyltransferase [Pseudomonadota bacterium]